MNKQENGALRSVSFNADTGLAVSKNNSSVLKLFIIIDRQEFTRGCLSSWIATFCPEFKLASEADAATSISAEMLEQASLVIFRANIPTLGDGWLEGQILWLRARRPDLPIVAIVEPEEVHPVADLIGRLNLQGYVPTTSSMEVAAAVLRLVAAGGTYLPQIRATASSAVKPLNRTHPASETARVPGLTPRECTVLELLERGMANKIIAYRLSLSQSTVKAHVHNIISKLKVHNRTEAAVAAHRLQRAAVERAVPSAAPEKQDQRRASSVPPAYEVALTS